MTRSPSAEAPKTSSKRKGTRSVSTLTPAQLARKRANDREAQRAIRARTKEHIERLERELEELKSRHSRDEIVQDLLRKNKALERELMALRESLGIRTNPYPTPDGLPSVHHSHHHHHQQHQQHHHQQHTHHHPQQQQQQHPHPHHAQHHASSRATTTQHHHQQQHSPYGHSSHHHGSSSSSSSHHGHGHGHGHGHHGGSSDYGSSSASSFGPSYLPTPEPCDSHWSSVVSNASGGPAVSVSAASAAAGVVAVSPGVSSPTSSAGGGNPGAASAADEYGSSGGSGGPGGSGGGGGYIPTSVPSNMLEGALISPPAMSSIGGGQKMEYEDIDSEHEYQHSSVHSQHYVQPQQWSVYPPATYYPQSPAL